MELRMESYEYKFIWIEIMLKGIFRINTIKLMHELDKNINVPLIISRPHPSDDLLEWKKLSKSFKKVK